MNHIYIHTADQDPVVVIQADDNSNFGMSGTTISHPATFNAILPALRKASRMPLQPSQDSKTRFPLEPTTPARRCWLIIKTANRAHTRGLTPLAIHQIADTIASEMNDSDIIKYFRELRDPSHTPHLTVDHIITLYNTSHQ